MSDILVDVKTVEQVQIEKLSAAIEELNLNIRENEAVSERICKSYVMLKSYNQQLTVEVMQLLNDIDGLSDATKAKLENIDAIIGLLSQSIGKERLTH